MVHQLRVDRRQERRVVTDVVFDDEDRLHAEGSGVMHHIPPILDVLDDGRHEPDIALPQEHTIE